MYGESYQEIPSRTKYNNIDVEKRKKVQKSTKKATENFRESIREIALKEKVPKKYNFFCDFSSAKRNVDRKIRHSISSRLVSTNHEPFRRITNLFALFVFLKV